MFNDRPTEIYPWNLGWTCWLCQLLLIDPSVKIHWQSNVFETWLDYQILSTEYIRLSCLLYEILEWQTTQGTLLNNANGNLSNILVLKKVVITKKIYFAEILYCDKHKLLNFKLATLQIYADEASNNSMLNSQTNKKIIMFKRRV